MNKPRSKRAQELSQRTAKVWDAVAGNAQPKSAPQTRPTNSQSLALQKITRATRPTNSQSQPSNSANEQPKSPELQTRPTNSRSLRLKTSANEAAENGNHQRKVGLNSTIKRSLDKAPAGKQVVRRTHGNGQVGPPASSPSAQARPREQPKSRAQTRPMNSRGSRPRTQPTNSQSLVPELGQRTAEVWDAVAEQCSAKVQARQTRPTNSQSLGAPNSAHRNAAKV